MASTLLFHVDKISSHIFKQHLAPIISVRLNIEIVRSFSGLDRVGLGIIMSFLHQTISIEHSLPFQNCNCKSDNNSVSFAKKGLKTLGMYVLAIGIIEEYSNAVTIGRTPEAKRDSCSLLLKYSVTL